MQHSTPQRRKLLPRRSHHHSSAGGGRGSAAKQGRTRRERRRAEEYVRDKLVFWGIEQSTVDAIHGQRLTMRDLWSIEARDLQACAGVPLGTALRIMSLAKQETSEGAADAAASGLSSRLIHKKGPRGMHPKAMDGELLLACLHISKVLLRIQSGKRFGEIARAMSLPDVEISDQSEGYTGDDGFAIFDAFNTSEDALRRRFVDIDADGSGGISVNELREALMMRGSGGVATRTSMAGGGGHSEETPDSTNSDDEDEATGHIVRDDTFVVFWRCIKQCDAFVFQQACERRAIADATRADAGNRISLVAPPLLRHCVRSASSKSEQEDEDKARDFQRQVAAHHALQLGRTQAPSRRLSRAGHDRLSITKLTHGKSLMGAAILRNKSRMVGLLKARRNVSVLAEHVSNMDFHSHEHVAMSALRASGAADDGGDLDFAAHHDNCQSDYTSTVTSTASHGSTVVGFRVRSIDYVDSKDIQTLSTSQMRGSARLLRVADRSEAHASAAALDNHPRMMSRMVSYNEHEAQCDPNEPFLSEALILEVVAQYRVPSTTTTNEERGGDFGENSSEKEGGIGSGASPVRTRTSSPSVRNRNPMGRFSDDNQVADVLRARGIIATLLEKELTDATWPPEFPHNSEFLDDEASDADEEFDLNDAVRELLDFLLRWALTRVEMHSDPASSQQQPPAVAIATESAVVAAPAAASVSSSASSSNTSGAEAAPPSPPTPAKKGSTQSEASDGSDVSPLSVAPSPAEHRSLLDPSAAPHLAAMCASKLPASANFFLSTMTDAARYDSSRFDSDQTLFKLRPRGGNFEAQRWNHMEGGVHRLTALKLALRYQFPPQAVLELFTMHNKTESVMRTRTFGQHQGQIYTLALFAPHHNKSRTIRSIMVKHWDARSTCRHKLIVQASRPLKYVRAFLPCCRERWERCFPPELLAEMSDIYIAKLSVFADGPTTTSFQTCYHHLEDTVFGDRPREEWRRFSPPKFDYVGFAERGEVLGDLWEELHQHRGMAMGYSELRNGDSSTLLYMILDCIVDRLRPIAKEMLEATDLLFKKLGEEGFHTERSDLFFVSRLRRLITALIQHIEHTKFVLSHAENECVLLLLCFLLSLSLSLSLSRPCSSLLTLASSVLASHPPCRWELKLERYDISYKQQNLVNYADTIARVDDSLQDLERCLIGLESWKQDYASISDRHMNKLLYLLTLVTAMVIPIQTLSGIFGMNFVKDDGSPNMWELNHESGYIFFWVLALSIAAIILVAFFSINGFHLLEI